jgi:hypothetical protein
MRRDAYISWSPFRRKREHYFSHTGALTTVLNLGVPAGTCLLALVLIVGMATGASKRLKVLSSIAVLVLTVAAGFVAYAALPTTAVRMIRGHSATRSRQSFLLTLFDVVEESEKEPPGTEERLRSRLQRRLRELFATEPSAATNPYTHQALREENSPGNYVIRTAGDKLQLLYYDADGSDGLFWEGPAAEERPPLSPVPRS